MFRLYNHHLLKGADGEWDKPTPLRGSSQSVQQNSNLFSKSSHLTTGRSSTVAAHTPNTILNPRIMRNLGFNVDFDEMNTNQDVDKSKLQSAYNGNEEDEDFDRDYYLAEEGGGGDYEEDSKFLGSETKFQQREDEMSRKRNQGIIMRFIYYYIYIDSIIKITKASVKRKGM